MPVHTAFALVYHFLQVRGYTSLRAVTPKGKTKGWSSWRCALGPGWHLPEQAPWSVSNSSSVLSPPQAPSFVLLACCSASLWTSSCIPSTKRESSSMLHICSRSGRTTGRLRLISKVSWPAGTLGSPCRNIKWIFSTYGKGFWRLDTICRKCARFDHINCS